MGNKNSRMDAGVGALVGQPPGTTLRRDSEGVVTFLAPTPFLHPGSRDRLAEVGSVKAGSIQSPSSQQLGSTGAATKTGHTSSNHGTPIGRMQQKQQQRIKSMGPGAPLEGCDSSLVLPSPKSTRRASSVVDAAMNACSAEKLAELGSIGAGQAQQSAEEGASQPSTVLSNDLKSQVKKLGKALARSMSKREKPTGTDTDKGGDKSAITRWDSMKSTKSNKRTADYTDFVAGAQTKESDDKRKSDGSTNGMNTNSMQKLSVTRSSNTIHSIPIKASSNLRAVKSTGRGSDGSNKGAAGFASNKLREQTTSAGINFGARLNMSGAGAETAGEQEEEVYTTTLKGASMGATGCDDQKTTTQPLGGNGTNYTAGSAGVAKHNPPPQQQSTTAHTTSKTPSEESGLYLEESLDTLQSLAPAKLKSGKTKHLPITNHHITAQNTNTTNKREEMPLRKTQSSLGLATGIMHISDRVPTSYDKKAKSFYAQSEPGLSSAKIAPSNKTRERGMSERVSSKKAQKINHARGLLEKGAGPTKGRKSTLTRSNSCSTLFVEQTVSNPDLDNILRCMAIAFHLQFLRLQREVNRPVMRLAMRHTASNMNDSSDALFLDNQSNRPLAKSVANGKGRPLSHKHSRDASNTRVRSGGFDSMGPQRFDANVSLPEFPSEFDEMKHPLTSRRVPSTYARVIPSASDTYDFLRALFSAALLKSEVAIVSMVYISRLSDQGGVGLQPANWKRVLLGACMLASKVWDDQAVWNTDFCDVLPDVAVEDMNALERVVLEKLAYDVSVTPAQYVEHYLAMRDYGVAADLHDGRNMPALTTSNNDFLSRPSSREFLDDNKKTQLLQTHSSDDLLGDGNAALLEMPVRDWSQARPV